MSENARNIEIKTSLSDLGRARATAVRLATKPRTHSLGWLRKEFAIDAADLMSGSYSDMLLRTSRS